MKRIMLLLCLAGCANKEIVYTPINNDVPVKCKVEQISPPQFPKYDINASLFEKVKNLLTENELRKGYEAKLVAVNEACK